MEIEQYVMAYHVEQDRLRAMLPQGYESLRPVLRFNAEVINDSLTYLELNTPVQNGEFRGWLNIAHWDCFRVERQEKKVSFISDFLNLSFVPVGIEGGCPAEKDNDGCMFLDHEQKLRSVEPINNKKEFCDCEFAWLFNAGDACGKSIGKTFPAFSTELKKQYPCIPLTAQNAAAIPCDQVLGSYVVRFERK